MASPTQWTWVLVNSRSWGWTGRPGVLQYMWWQRVGHDWATEQQQMWDLICFSEASTLRTYYPQTMTRIKEVERRWASDGQVWKLWHTVALSPIQKHLRNRWGGTNAEAGKVDVCDSVHTLVLVVKDPPATVGRFHRHRFDSWVGRSLEKEMATHSSILAWRIPWTNSLAGYSSRGCKSQTWFSS